jgi:ABC-type transport system substrate-binding protein
MNRNKVLCLAIIAAMAASLCFVAVTPANSEYTFFTAVLIAPTNNPVRVQHAQLVANELPKIGIGTNLLLVGWDVLVPRMQGSLTHADYAGGGFDIGFIGWTGTNIYQYFHSSNIDPASWGSNYYPVENDTLDALLEFTANTTDFDTRKDYYAQALDVIVWDIHPVTSIYQPENVYFMRDNIQDFDASRFPYQSIEEMSFEGGASAGHGNVNELIVASTTRPADYSPVVSNSYYDNLVFSPAFTGMISVDSGGNWVTEIATTLPYPVAEVNQYDGELSSTDPNNATVWEIQLREDVYWHEGYGYNMDDHRDVLRVDAYDIAWYYGSIIDEDGPPNPTRGVAQFPLGSDPSKAFKVVNSTTIQFHLYNIYADLFGLFSYDLLPQHILDPDADEGFGVGTRADGSSTPSYDDWDSDDFNQGSRSSPYTGTATVGCGPYMMDIGENPTQQTVTLSSNPYYYKDNDTAYWKPLVANRFDKYIYTWIANKDSAEIALENGDIDIMDAQYGANKDYPVMRNKPGIAAPKQLDAGWQSLGYNILNGADGELANKWVRLAISHMVPRQDIVDYLLGGLGQTNFAPFGRQLVWWPDDLEEITYNYTRALEYMEKAGFDIDLLTQTTADGFELLALFMALGGMAAVVIYRHKKRSI